MARYLVSISCDGDVRGSIISVDAHSEMDAYDAVLMDRGSDGDITILGTCDEVALLATERGLERTADYETEDYDAT
jgi:hypothetical protein